MKIATRLMTLCAAGSLALIGAGMVGIYGVKNIQERFQFMTTRTAPLGSALLELQEGKERTFGALLAMSHASTPDEANLIKLEIEKELGSLVAIAGRINDLSPSGSIDTKQFRDAYRSISDRVDDRFRSTVKFKRAAMATSDTLIKMNRLTDEVNRGVQTLANTASTVARQAQASAYELLDLEQSAREIKERMAEMTVLVYATDALSSKFRASPVRERWEAVHGSIARLADSDSTAPRLAQALPDLDALNAAFAGGAGLLQLKLDVLNDVSGAKSTYKKARKTMMASITDGSRRLSELVGELKLELVVKRQAVEQALAMSGDPASITSINQRLIQGIKDVRIELGTLMLAEQAEQLASAREQLQSRLSDLATLSTTLATDLEPLGVKELSASANRLSESLVQVRELVEAVAQGKRARLESEHQLNDSLMSLKQSARVQREQGRARLSDIAELQSSATSSVDERVNIAIVLIGLISLVGLTGSVLFSYFSGRVIVNRLRGAVAVAEAVSSGRLEQVAPDHHNDEISSLLASLGRMVCMLDTSVRQIRGASASVNEGTKEIDRGNTALSQRTDQQARFLHETSETSEQISSTVRESAQTAEKASALTSEASEAANRSRQVINDAITTMQDIEAGALEISNIISVIDGIAFQTNILALNAAVEAARAGEAGRGFAVVASEVGQLAQQSKESAHKIKDIIDKNVTQVESGSDLVRNAGRHMEEVFDKVTNVARLISDVSDTGTRQVESISSIHAAISNLDAMTRDNLSLSEQTSLSASNLLEQARSMNSAVSVFQLSANDPLHSVTSRPATG